MKIAVISDIHSNYDALSAVLKQIDALSPDAVYCAGDIVGYGAQPAECVRALRERGIPSVAGNHDFATAGITPVEYFNDDAQRSVAWTRAVLAADDIAYLRDLPLVLEQDDFLIFHGTLAEPESFNYILSLQEADAAFALLDRPIGFFGHSHAPLSFLRTGDAIVPTLSEELSLVGIPQALINVGSVGQPRDFNPLAAFAVCDLAARSVRLERVAYDIAAAAQKILDAGLPEASAQRLYQGR